jgi:hypothetical protein
MTHATARTVHRGSVGGHARPLWYSLPPAARRPIRRGRRRFAAATSTHRVSAGNATRTSQEPARSGRRGTRSKWRRPSESLLLLAACSAPGVPDSEQCFERVTSGPYSVLLPKPPRSPMSAPRTSDCRALARSPRRGSGVPGQSRASDADSRHSCGVIKLIVGVGHYEHRATGTHRQPGRSDASSMNNHSRPWEQFRKGRIVAGDHAIGQRCRAVAGILPDNDHGPETEALRSRNALFVERPGDLCP